ncbi:MAG: hypothetical protein R2836_03540 [Chitinophagales bacterium]
MGTEETPKCRDNSHVKENMSNGLAHVPISKETTFKLIAKGLFNSVEKEITAHPFLFQWLNKFLQKLQN